MRPADVPGAREEVRAVMDALDAAWNSGNATAYAAPFAADARLIAPNGVLFPSREGVRQLHGALFGGPFAGSSRKTISLDVAFLTGTLAVVDRVGDTTNWRFLPPGTVPSLPGVLRVRERQIYERRGNAWVILFSQVTAVAPAPPAP